ncbi:MAG: endonuclease/exonuclease/phosphatase family protein [Bacteroidota bacterium]
MLDHVRRFSFSPLRVDDLALMTPRTSRRWFRRFADARERLRDQVPYVEHFPVNAGPPTQRSPLRIVSYNVHRWSGVAGGNRYRPELASRVIEELDADVLGLQEVLVPFDQPDPVLQLAQDLDLHLVRVATRAHRRGALCNAILSRYPVSRTQMIDLTLTRVEKRSAILVRLADPVGVEVVSTHLAIVDRTRRRQVQTLLGHSGLQGPVVVLGDMNAWRQCKATRELDREFIDDHNNANWPATFPSRRPLLALDRIYARGADVLRVNAVDTPAARLGSDHLPVVAEVAV